MKHVPAFALAAVLLAGCGSSTGSLPVFTESEDCDAEDFRNMEDDCGFTDSDRKKYKKKMAKWKAPSSSTSKSTTFKTKTYSKNPRH